MRISLLFIALLANLPAIGQEDVSKSWVRLALIKIKYKFSEKHNTYLYIPVMDQHATDLDGEELTIRGYFLPFDMPGGEIVISENPYSSCFFCGGAGPGSIIEVKLRSASSHFEVDELITVRGKLRINSDDPDHSVFILEDAEVVAR